jgi:transposase
MIDPETRNAIVLLHQAGMSQREIGRRLNVSRNSVGLIIKQQGKVDRQERSDKIHLDADLLRRLYRECDGWVERMHEKLVEEEGIVVGYSTLTRRIREMGLGQNDSRCDRVPDEPGGEMQHDTTVYQVKLGGRRTRVIASLLYLRYSKRRYLKFYLCFNRFAMKCFLHEALMFWAYAAWLCIIDNTNLARLRGAGYTAVIAPEMAAFSRRYGFKFVCHAIRHANRKAGEERSFWTVQTNFLPGRTFDSLEDLNRQAHQWATGRMEKRPQGKAGLVPAEAFETERSYLQKLPPMLPAPYQQHCRGTDQYGYVAFQANYYWVPGSRRETVKVLQFADRLKIYLRHTCLAEYPLPPSGVKNQRYSPVGEPQPPARPKNRKQSSQREQQRLHALGEEVAAYLDFALKAAGIQRHRFLRKLFALSRQVPNSVFVETARRALQYRILDLATLRRIAWLCMSQADEGLPEADVDEDYQQRDAYQEGCLTEEPDLSIYEDLSTEPEDEPEDEKEDHDDDRPF